MAKSFESKSKLTSHESATAVFHLNTLVDGTTLRRELEYDVI